MSANATARAVLQRMAGPLRHELAGALLVPQMQLLVLLGQAGQLFFLGGYELTLFPLAGL